MSKRNWDRAKNWRRGFEVSAPGKRGLTADEKAFLERTFEQDQAIQAHRAAMRAKPPRPKPVAARVYLLQRAAEQERRIRDANEDRIKAALRKRSHISCAQSATE